MPQSFMNLMTMSATQPFDIYVVVAIVRLYTSTLWTQRVVGLSTRTILLFSKGTHRVEALCFMWEEEHVSVAALIERGNTLLLLLLLFQHFTLTSTMMLVFTLARRWPTSVVVRNGKAVVMDDSAQVYQR